MKTFFALMIFVCSIALSNATFDLLKSKTRTSQFQPTTSYRTINILRSPILVPGSSSKLLSSPMPISHFSAQVSPFSAPTTSYIIPPFTGYSYPIPSFPGFRLPSISYVGANKTPTSTQVASVSVINPPPPPPPSPVYKIPNMITYPEPITYGDAIIFCEEPGFEDHYFTKNYGYRFSY